MVHRAPTVYRLDCGLAFSPIATQIARVVRLSKFPVCTAFLNLEFELSKSESARGLGHGSLRIIAPPRPFRFRSMAATAAMDAMPPFHGYCSTFLAKKYSMCFEVESLERAEVRSWKALQYTLNVERQSICLRPTTLSGRTTVRFDMCALWPLGCSRSIGTRLPSMSDRPGGRRAGASFAARGAATDPLA